jgi:ketosteroid isomerase-like protein
LPVYKAIVRARIRATWRRAGAGDYRAAIEQAAPDIHFRFVGPPPVGADLRGREAFEAWFANLYELLPGIRMTLRDVRVAGWPWDTFVAVRLSIHATLTDGSEYRNEAIQWITLRWGRMVEDIVFEDTARLMEALRRQHIGAPGQA